MNVPKSYWGFFKHAYHRINSCNHQCVCHIELSNPSCLTVACNRGSAKLTDTVRHEGYTVRYGKHRVIYTFFLHFCFVLCTLIIELIWHYVARFTTEQKRCGLILLYLPYKEYHTRHGKRHLPYKKMSTIKMFHVNIIAALFCSVNQQLSHYLPP